MNGLDQNNKLTVEHTYGGGEKWESYTSGVKECFLVRGGKAWGKWWRKIYYPWNIYFATSNQRKYNFIIIFQFYQFCNIYPWKIKILPILNEHPSNISSTKCGHTVL